MMFYVTFEQKNKPFDPQFDNVVEVRTERVGATFFPSVSEEGIISWTNNANLPNPAPINIKGKAGVDGKDGVNGKDGINGYTPVKGTDYWTDGDKTEMVDAVIAALPVYNGEVV